MELENILLTKLQKYMILLLTANLTLIIANAIILGISLYEGDKKKVYFSSFIIFLNIYSFLQNLN